MAQIETFYYRQYTVARKTMHAAFEALEIAEGQFASVAKARLAYKRDKQRMASLRIEARDPRPAASLRARGACNLCAHAPSPSSANMHWRAAGDGARGRERVARQVFHVRAAPVAGGQGGAAGGEPRGARAALLDVGAPRARRRQRRALPQALPQGHARDAPRERVHRALAGQGTLLASSSGLVTLSLVGC